MEKNGKRQKLIAAALEATAEKGYKNLRISDITEKAGVGKGTFYLYFNDKEECFARATESIGIMLEKKYLACLKEGAPADVRAIAEATYDEVWENRRLGRAYAYEFLETDRAGNRSMTARHKNVYREIARAVNPEESEETLEIKALTIMGIIDALSFEVFHCDDPAGLRARERFVKAFEGIIGMKA